MLVLCPFSTATPDEFVRVTQSENAEFGNVFVSNWLAKKMAVNK